MRLRFMFGIGVGVSGVGGRARSVLDTHRAHAHPSLTLCNRPYQVLHGVDGHLETGQMLAVIGPSGSGKTCLLDILAERKTIGKISGLRLLDGQVR